MSESPPKLSKTPTIYSVTTKKGGLTRNGLINFVDDKHTHAPRPYGWRKVFRRPIIRQFMKDGSIYREREEREPSRSELFFDLIFVGIIRQLTEGATEEFSGLSVVKFVLLFFPSWTIWQDTRSFLNMSGTDDVIQRLYILSIMALLLGYGANASAIILPSQTIAHDEHSVFPTLRAAIAFFLVARLLRLIIYLVYAFSIPKFFSSLIVPAFGLAFQSSFYVPLIWVKSEKVFLVLTTVGMVIDLFMRYTLGLALGLNRRRIQHLGSTGKGLYRPALNIEHHIERTSQFIIIVLGEAVLNLTYKAVSSSTGLRGEYLRAVLCLIAAYFLCWLYFDQDVSQTYIHALRRHWFSALSTNMLHFPFCCGLIIWSASMAFLVHPVYSGSVDTPALVSVSGAVSVQGVRWYFSGGLATALVCLAMLGWMHKNLDARGSSLIPWDVRLAFRVIAAIIVALLPLSKTLRDPNKSLGVHVAILAGLVLCDTVGKIGTMPNVEELKGLLVVPQGREGETELEARAVEKASRENPLEDVDTEFADEESEVLPVVGTAMTKKHELAVCSCS